MGVQRTKAELRAFFADGKFPIGDQFDDFIESVWNLLETETVASQGGLKRKVIDIGDWNMDTTLGVSVAHGLDATKIRNVSVIIRNDSDTFRSNLIEDPNGLFVVSGNIGIDNTNIVLSRLGGGGYDDIAYNSAPFNRGFIVIDFIP